MKRVLVVGEGPNELGHESGPDKPAARGVLEALARTHVSEGWEVAKRIKWKDIPKYKVGGHKSAEERNLLGALNRAIEQQYDAVLLARDTDGDEERRKQCERGLTGALELWPELQGRVAAGFPAPMLEAWVLALQGERKTQGMRRTKLEQALLCRGYNLDDKDTARLVDFVEGEGAQHPPQDATDLQRWLEAARSCLSRT